MNCPAQRRAAAQQSATPPRPPEPAPAGNVSALEANRAASPDVPPAQVSPPQRQISTPPSPAAPPGSGRDPSSPAQNTFRGSSLGTGPLISLAPGAAASNPGTGASAARAQTPTPVTAARAQLVPPQPSAPSQIAAPLPANGRRGIITSVISGQMRRPPNGPAAAALLGSGLLILAIGMIAPCLVILALVGAYFLRRTLLRVVFPGGTVTTWNCIIYDQAQSTSFSALIFDPEGTPPEIGAYVLVRGRQQATFFRATEIIREVDARGNRVPAREGLFARQMPPPWLGYGLLGLGLLACLPLWLMMLR